jgi:hypothetical protein
VSISVFHEPEVVELLADDPELLALADAIAATQAGRRRRGAARILVAAAITAALAAIAVASPWHGSSRPSLVDRALAAIGSGPVLHAVLEHERLHELVAVDLTTSRERPLPATTEIWFDEKRDVEHSTFRIDGQLKDEALQSRTRIVTPHSSSSHPRGAAPWLDPALREFLDGYRSALASGRATRDGQGMVDGRSVMWLRFSLEHGYQRVAIDSETSLPIRVVTYWGGPPTIYAVRRIETLPEGAGNFVPPRTDRPEPEYYQRLPVRIAPRAASRVVPGALAAGTSFHGLPLVKVVETKLSTVFKPDEHVAPRVAKGLEFEYGTDDFRDAEPFLIVAETSEPEALNGWLDGPMPRPGEVVVGFDTVMLVRAHWSGLTVKDGIYLTILAPSRDVVLAAARALEPFSP